MILPMDNEALYLNIKNDTMKKGSAAGDIILVQDTGDLEQEDLVNLINKYNSSLPLKRELLNERSLRSVKNPLNTIILGAYVFNNFSVNGIPFSSEKNFLIFIRQALTGKKKVTLCAQPTRKLPSEDVDNEAVLDELSKTIDNQGFRVDAIHYIEDEDRLDFIVNIFGSNALNSEVFMEKDAKLDRQLKDFPYSEVKAWTDLQFSFNVIYLLKKYGLEHKSLLLRDNGYCEKLFDLNPIITNNEENLTDDLYSTDKIYFDNQYFFIISSWINLKGRNSREKFWIWLLDNIMDVSSDVKIAKKSKQINVLLLPSYYKKFFNYHEGNYEFPYDIELRYLDDIPDEEYKGEIKEKSSKKFLAHKNYFKKQNLRINDEVVVVDHLGSEFIFSDVMKVKVFNEQSFILSKGNGFINNDFKQEFLSMIREDLDG